MSSPVKVKLWMAPVYLVVGLPVGAVYFVGIGLLIVVALILLIACKIVAPFVAAGEWALLRVRGREADYDKLASKWGASKELFQ